MKPIEIEFRQLNLRIGPSSTSAAFRIKSRSARWDVDGRIYLISSRHAPPKKQEGDLALKEHWYPIRVKQLGTLGRPDLDSFEAMLTRGDWAQGFFDPFDYSRDSVTEASRFFNQSRKVIIPLTVRGILDE